MAGEADSEVRWSSATMLNRGYLDRSLTSESIHIWIAAAAYRQSPLLVAGLNSAASLSGARFCAQRMVLEYPAVLEDQTRKPTSLSGTAYSVCLPTKWTP